MDNKIILGATIAYLLYTQSKSEAGIIVPESVPTELPEQPLVTPEKQRTILQEQYWYAEWQLPIFSIINRIQTQSITQAFTSLGAADVSKQFTTMWKQINSFEDLGNLDLSNIPTETWVKMGADLTLSITASMIGGPIGWIMALAQLSMSVFDMLSADDPKKKMKRIIEKIQNMPRDNKVVTTDGLLLGTLATNRVSSCMIPLFKVKSTNFFDELYVTSDYLPVFNQYGYTANTQAVGYVSKIPFGDSVSIKLLYNMLLADFVVVVDGSEYERVLTNIDYFPIIDSMGYISTKIQAGQRGVYIPNFDQTERITHLSKQSMTFILNYSSAIQSRYHTLASNVALSRKGTSEFPHGDIRLPKYGKGYSVSIWAKEYYRRGVIYGKSLFANIDSYTNFRIPSDPKIAAHYEAINRVVPIHDPYLGIPLPPPGSVSNLLFQNETKTYLYGNKRITILRGTERILVRQVNGNIVEIIIGNNIGPTEKFLIVTTARELASNKSPGSSLRLLLGDYLRIDRGRPVYIIDSLTKLYANREMYNKNQNMWT